MCLSFWENYVESSIQRNMEAGIRFFSLRQLWYLGGCLQDINTRLALASFPWTLAQRFRKLLKLAESDSPANIILKTNLMNQCCSHEWHCCFDINLIKSKTDLKFFSSKNISPSANVFGWVTNIWGTWSTAGNKNILAKIIYKNNETDLNYFSFNNISPSAGCVIIL